MNMVKFRYTAFAAILALAFFSCEWRRVPAVAEAEAQLPADTVVEEPPHKPLEITIEKALLYDHYTLEDVYPYKDTTRHFQWDKIREALRVIDSVQMEPAQWGVLRNRGNANGAAPLVKEWHRNDYKNVSDNWEVQRYQSVPLYIQGDSVPERYGRDGSWVKILGSDTTGAVNLVRVRHIENEGVWDVPEKYVKAIVDTLGVGFYKVAVVDRTFQNIASLEKEGDKWLVRSMNPVTTGVRRPPYAHETPLGYFVVQEKKSKMIYTHDGSDEYAGYAPWASRFSNGAYLHGVPTTNIDGPILEYSRTLGTIPRSHMCVRNASSHAKFLYDMLPIDRALVVVIE